MAPISKAATERYNRLWSETSKRQVPTSKGATSDTDMLTNLLTSVRSSNSMRNNELLTGERFGLGQAAHSLQRAKKKKRA